MPSRKKPNINPRSLASLKIYINKQEKDHKSLKNTTLEIKIALIMFKLMLIFYYLSKTMAFEIKQDHTEFYTNGHYPDCSDGHRPE